MSYGQAVFFSNQNWYFKLSCCPCFSRTQRV